VVGNDEGFQGDAMNDEVAAGLAEGIAELVRLVPAPTAPLGYGVDLHCTTDIRDDLAEVDPFSIRSTGTTSRACSIAA
jgi:hypothetical protein